MTGIEALEELLGSLRITEEYTSDRNKTTEPVTLEEISIASVVQIEIVQTVTPRSKALVPEQFDGNKI